MAGTARGLYRPPSPYAWFVAGIGTWALAAGLHQVVYAWLVVGELRQSAGWTGVAQMVPMLPSLAFLLLGGAVADRVDRRRLTLLVHALAALVAATLGLLVAGGRASLPVLLGYAFAWGTLQAFNAPARDAMISEIAGPDLMRAVTGVTLTQFSAAALGARLGGLGVWLGSPALLGLQAAVLALGLFPVSRLPHDLRTARLATDRGGLSGIRAGVREVWHSERLLPIALLVAANGLFYMGPYAVLCPIIVRDVYHGGLADLSLVMTALPLGTIAGSAAVLVRGGIRRKGLTFLLALLGVALCLASFPFELPFPAFVVAIFVWGVAHSLFFNTSRTLFQEAASASHRGRVLAVHSLAFLGMAPASHLGFGLLGDALGPIAACALAGAAMLVLTGVAFLVTPVRRFV